MNIRKILLSLGLSLSFASAMSQVTVEECVRLAEENYPLIKKYELMAATAEVDLSDIDKSWLPRIGLYAQGTIQNVVPSFPETLTGILKQMGQEMKGLGRFQYKVGAELNQTIWDGNSSRLRREAVRAKEGVSRDALAVELYGVRQRIESLFFACLLTQEQIKQSNQTAEILKANAARLMSMLANGTATQADLAMVEAQYLTVKQNITQAEYALRGYRRSLEIFTGSEFGDKTLVTPEISEPGTYANNRPELRLFDSLRKANEASGRLFDTSLLPKVGFFAQAYYGYPGFDYFKSMINRDLSFNLLAGIKVSWNIDPFYSKANNAKKTALANLEVEADRETFLFNTELQTASQTETIRGLREVIANDKEIVALREKVRRAAESQLLNGVIDPTGLLTKIADENLARLNTSYHQIQLIKEIYNLKYTLNR